MSAVLSDEGRGGGRLYGMAWHGKVLLEQFSFISDFIFDPYWPNCNYFTEQKKK
jgi:hypothetical protein